MKNKILLREILSKEKFIEVIEELHSLENDIQNVHSAMKKLDPDFGGFYLSRVSTLVLNLLEKAIGDKYQYINYFIYDLDYGKKWKKRSVVDTKNGKFIKLKTISDLYDYIIKIQYHEK